MAAKPAQLAKLSRPTAGGLIERPRLFALLDQACQQRIVWLSAPAGAGKTSIVTSYLENRHKPCLWYQIDTGDNDPPTFFHYLGRAAQNISPRKRPLPSLTPEYLAGIETFVRRFFRSLFERLLPPTVLIFDNFHEASPDSPLHRLLSFALDEIPPDNTVIFISRHNPPSPLARIYSNSAVIDWTQLKLTFEEAGKLLNSYGQKNPAFIQSLNDAAQGWIAGLVLLARSRDNAEILFPKEPKQTHLLYDYFAQEVLNKIPENHHNILIKTSLLPSVTPAAACTLTGLARAGEVIAALHRERFFIDRHGQKSESYVYHPLFRSFLLRQAETRYSESERIQLKQKAARLLEVTQFEAAIGLYLETASWNEAARLIKDRAFEMLSEGRHALLNQWLDHLPQDASGQDPYLRYWSGLCRMPFNPAESRNALESTFQLFKAQNHAAGMFLALSAILTSYYYEWGNFSPVSRWLGELEALLDRHPELPSLEVEVQVASAMMAVLLHCPQHPLIKSLKARVVSLIRACSSPQQKMAVASPVLFYDLLSGDFGAAGDLLLELKDALDMKRISPADAIAFKIFESIYAWKQGFYPDAIAKLTEAGDIAHASGVHLFDSHIFMHKCLAYAGADQLQELAELILEQRKVVRTMRRGDFLTLKFHEAALNFKRGVATRSILDALQEMVQEAQAFATPYYEAETRFLYSQTLLAFGEQALAKQQFDWIKTFAKAMPCRHIEFRTLIVESHAAFSAGNLALGFDRLKGALAIGAAQGYVSCPQIWQANVLPSLFAKALEAHIETDYARSFIRANKLKAPSSDTENWPWPLKIHTLGRFEVFIDDHPLHFQGKTQKRPLELLKCLISGSGNGVSQVQLAAQIWPDLEGDAARNACDLALHRLRKLLNKYDVLDVQDGKLSLDSSYVWVDVWAFEHLCSALDAGLYQHTALAAAQKLLTLYHGQFLGSEDSAWALSYRERANSKFQRCIERLTHQLAAAEAWDETIALYRKAIELDPLVESFHRGLMRAYQAQGRIAEALVAYRHCHDMLSIVLGIKPSSETEAIYRSLKSS